MNFVTTRKEALDVMERYIENNISIFENDEEINPNEILILDHRIEKIFLVCRPI